MCGALEAVEVVAEADAFAARRGERRGVKEEFIVGKERKELERKGNERQRGTISLAEVCKDFNFSRITFTHKCLFQCSYTQTL